MYLTVPDTSMYFPTFFDDFFKTPAIKKSSIDLDIEKHENGYTVTADLPGLSDKDINVKIENGYLTISGKKEETKRGGLIHSERRITNEFKRSIRVGDDINAEKTSAAMKNGVLTVELPIAEAKKPKQIEVKVK